MPFSFFVQQSPADEAVYATNAAVAVNTSVLLHIDQTASSLG